MRKCSVYRVPTQEELSTVEVLLQENGYDCFSEFSIERLSLSRFPHESDGIRIVRDEQLGMAGALFFGWKLPEGKKEVCIDLVVFDPRVRAFEPERKAREIEETLMKGFIEEMRAAGAKSIFSIVRPTDREAHFFKRYGLTHADDPLVSEHHFHASDCGRKKTNRVHA